MAGSNYEFFFGCISFGNFFLYGLLSLALNIKAHKMKGKEDSQDLRSTVMRHMTGNCSLTNETNRNFFAANFSEIYKLTNHFGISFLKHFAL